MKTVFGLILVLAATFGFAQTPAPTAAPKKAAVTAKPAAAKSSLPLTGEPTLAKVDASGVLRVGVAINAPWVMHDERGEPTGYSVDIAHRLAEAMGWKLQIVETSWPRLMFGLRTDQYDVIISGLSITPQRARYVQFTDPVGEFDVDAVVNRGKVRKGGVAELRKLAHAKVAAHKGELTVEFARGALPNAEVVEVEDEDAAIADVRNGKLDAYVAEAPLPHLLETIYPDKLRALSGEPLARTAHGFAVRKGDVGLLRVLNAWIVYEKASGWLKSRSDYWFEETGWAADL